MPSRAESCRSVKDSFAPSPAPSGHPLPQGARGVPWYACRAVENRRKSCALIPGNAHNRALGVRVGALTNKAAHNQFGLVRTRDCAVRVLTLIYDVTIDGFCRERRGEPITARRGVRNLGRPAHMRESPTRASAHENEPSAPENAAIYSSRAA